MNAANLKPELNQVQGLVAFGYNTECCRHYVLRVTNREQALAFIAQIVNAERIANASSAAKARTLSISSVDFCAVSLGFTHDGLQALGLPSDYLGIFRDKAAAFTKGAYYRAASDMADTGSNAASFWEDCFKPDQAHLLLILHANLQSRIDAVVSMLQPGSSGLSGWDNSHHGSHLTADRQKRTAHFGVRDGIANPKIKTLYELDPANQHNAKPMPADICADGDFLLGYLNQEKFNDWGDLPLELADFFRGASFGAFRKIEQHEDRFHKFLRVWAANLDVSEEYVRAKLVGRWDDGSVVQPGQRCSGAPPDENTIDDFDFASDPKGVGCPFGSHIRRMNPRGDYFQERGMRDDYIVPVRKRPLIRRGMPYGPLYDEDPGAERGLLGLFFCASIEDQFEHLLASWADSNPMGPHNRGTAKDPLIGQHSEPHALFDIPMPPTAEHQRRIGDFTPFVTTRGTLYAFFPTLGALASMPKLCCGKVTQ